MVFSSIVFLLYFFPIFLLIYFFIDKEYKNAVLLIGSIFFYAWGAPKFIFVILLTTFIDFHLVKWMDDNLEVCDRNKPIGMYCTGGVRCEKSTAYLISKGFKKVYHLDGGVIKYFMQATNKNNYWDGRCFVFDDRVAVDANLKPYLISDF